MTTEQFKTLIVRHQPAMQRMAEHLLQNEAEAEDAVQEALVKLWNQRQELEQTALAEAFCIAVVKRRCIDMLRKRHPSVPVDEASLPAVPSSEDPAARYQEAMRLIEKLPPRQQQAIRMKYEEELPAQEIARRLGITVEKLYTTLSRAYAALKELIQKQES